MKLLQRGYIAGPVLLLLWSLTLVYSIAIFVTFAGGAPARPFLPAVIVVGALAGIGALQISGLAMLAGVSAIAGALLSLLGIGPLQFGGEFSRLAEAIVGAFVVPAISLTGRLMLQGTAWGELNRHEFEEAVIRFLTGFGLVFFIVIVMIPFFVMIATSLKSQQELLQNPLDYSIDMSKGWDLLRSYRELFADFMFGSYLWTSFVVSVVTVIVTLLFSIPGAYAVARLRFRGRREFSQSILLIYMVPMIVLALPIYMLFSMTGLRNSLFGLILIYPVTTIPVALYILQGYFRGLPFEVEEAGLMDGLNRLSVIRRITLPLSLPSIASVSLYVFMIA
ncbi:MAG: carbohydrate ABC transporter permease, partial [Albidovulum sp.]|nr:carbohydrate ABC transporter permease [Albidovulum sp.]